MRLLLLCSFYTGYATQLFNNLKKYYTDMNISILTSKAAEERYKDTIAMSENESIYTYSEGFAGSSMEVFNTIRELPFFDVIQPLWMESNWGLWAVPLRKKAGHIYISVGGSDLYRQSKKKWIRYLQKRLIKRASAISSENTATRDTFYATYGVWTRSIPHYITRFGVDVIESVIDLQGSDIADIKRRWKLPLDKTVIMLGHNGSDAHQHLEMIDSLSKIDGGLLTGCFFVIPMTYGIPSDDYKKKVENAIASLTDSYTILYKYMNIDEMAQVTMITDIMVHMQKTDQLSSSMMSQLFCENVVLAGKWLPYSDIKEKGIKLFDVADFDDLRVILSDVIKDIDKYKRMCKGNKEKVYEFSSWEYCVRSWHRVYEELLNGASN